MVAVKSLDKKKKEQVIEFSGAFYTDRDACAYIEGSENNGTGFTMTLIIIKFRLALTPISKRPSQVINIKPTSVVSS